MEEFKDIIAKAKKEIEEEIKYNHYLRTGSAMDIVERVTGQSFADDEVYDDLMDILDKATKNLNSLTLQNGEGYYIGTRKEDVKEFTRLVDISDRDDVWGDYVDVDGDFKKLFNFI